MMAGRSILVATDFSPHARHAAERAARVAQEQGASLTLLHVLAGPGLAQLQTWLGAGTDLEDRVLQEVREQLDATAERLRDAGRVNVEAVLRDGPVVAALLQEAERTDAGLLVLGARGAGFMRRLVIGTTSERLVRKSSRPVLVVRQTPRERYRRVLVAVDFSEWSAGVLEAARRLAPHAHLVVAHAFSVPYQSRLRMAGVQQATIDRYREQSRMDAMQRLHALMAAAGVPSWQWEPRVAEGAADFCLLELEQENDCDLVVVGKQGASAAVDVLLGSVTSRVIAEGGVDVLVSTVSGS
jgi:nucleotide-binding universal stress UspA family protein